jgi:hypothetical protein
LNWFKAKCKLTHDRKVSLQYDENTVTSNKLNWEVAIKYVLVKEGEPKEIPPKSPMTFYKAGLPFLFLSTSGTIGNKIISEELIDDDILVDDDIIEIKEGKPEITFEDARDPKEHIEVRTRFDRITRRITIENKLDNEINLVLEFKQTKDVTFIKSDPEPSKIEQPDYKYDLKIPSEEKSRVSFEFQAKIVSRTTKIKPAFIKDSKT